MESIVQNPWIVAGDFNCVLYNNEKIGPSNSSTNANEAFYDAISLSGLQEMKCTCNSFSWRRRKFMEHIAK